MTANDDKVCADPTTLSTDKDKFSDSGNDYHIQTRDRNALAQGFTRKGGILLDPYRLTDLTETLPPQPCPYRPRRPLTDLPTLIAKGETWRQSNNRPCPYKENPEHTGDSSHSWKIELPEGY